ncbi:DNA translocase FtsK [Vagococcus sp. BWB3-3]|uniref:DNA translocase FtsK n=1 Tax=Vagococcus allomyrinae TaxID=2794353 RepID=A0A940STG3_9ENTE|nr:DNA translocase FtsK [Vagococcus allomyrinae]MBP1043107.1 DNA translocase FtsK [Vagococcus allomyrinae]
MAKKKNTRAKMTKKQQAQRERMVYLFIGIIFVLFGLFGTLKLGFLGILIANVFRFIAGNTYPVMGVLLIIYGLLLVFMGKELKIKKKKLAVGAVIFYCGLLMLLHAWLFKEALAGDVNIISVTWQKLFTEIRGNVIKESVGGGMIGAVLYGVSYFLVSQLGTYIIAGLLMLIGVFLIADIHWFQVVDFLKLGGSKLGSNLSEHQAKLAERREVKAAQKADAAEKQRLADEAAAEEARKNNVRDLSPGEQLARTEAAETIIEKHDEPEQLALEIDSYQNQYQTEVKEPIKRTASKKETEGSDEELEFEIPEETEDRDYLLPPSDILNEIPLTDQSDEYSSIEKNVGVLENTFKSFGVDAKVVRASLGPSVTKYEIQPAVGVKVSKIVGLTDDLALALAAKDIRMEAPIPGKSLIGIEVPNNAVSTVSFRDIVEAQPKHDDNLLEVPLGRDISGSVISADLAKMPHLLIAGSTGSGKSVCINGIITSILMRAKPHEVKMMMIDPKMVELNVYNGIPHLLTPVVTNPRKAAQALHKVVTEMERRYELFAGSGVRNITGYNQMVMQHNMEDGENRPVLPFIVVIVDELADLMMVASNEVEDAITRLAQMARAAGIHMILATQRPSVDVITGIIKANVPSRIAFAVSSGTDSRTIIDSNGAEKLLGRGDMLFLPMGENKPIRVQGAFISDSEVEDIVGFVTEQQGADYQESMMPSDEPSGGSGNGEPLDELFDDAVAMVIEMDTASISMIQRRFRVGYNRAARIVDQMEEQGVVGPPEGSKPRKVLVSFMSEEEPTGQESLDV